MSKNNIILHLSLVDGIGPATIQTLIDKKSDLWQWHDLYQMAAIDIQKIFCISEDKAQKIVEGLSDVALLDQELQLIERHNISWKTILDDDYPELLKHIYLPPAVLYFQGPYLNPGDQAIAVVGSRAMNWYGKKAIELLVPPLVQEGFIIVSGGAIGADSCAHKVTLEHGGKTIVVLGSGLLQPYPACNKSLFEQVIKAGGTILSPFPLTMAALPGIFLLAIGLLLD